MTFTILLALSGLTLSAVAIYYSVIGLTAIFAAAFWPIVVMGTTLEISKLVAASWLKANWTRIPILMKAYMMIAVVILMLITSMGIFGFLSKAHTDQSLVSGDVQSKIAVYDEQIKTAKDNIDANRKALKQMDEAVDQVMARSTSETGADKAVALRRAQLKERARLQSEIQAEQKAISNLSQERAPIAAEVRKVEAEVGPIKYIAKLIYGTDSDTNLLEKAVTWVIMVIVFVFDPLAVLLLLASQMTWAWYRKDREEQAEGDSPSRIQETEQTTVTESPWPFMAVVPTEVQNVQTDRTTAEPIADPGQSIRNEPSLNLQPESLPNDESVGIQPRHENDNGPVGTNDAVEQPQEQDQKLDDNDLPAQVGLEAWNAMIEEAEQAAREERKQKIANEFDDFPLNPKKGDEFKKLIHDEIRNYIYNGDQWVNKDTADQIALEQLTREVDDLELLEESKKKTYMIKEQNHQIKKTTTDK